MVLLSNLYGWFSKLFSILEAILEGASTIVFMTFYRGGNINLGGLFLITLIGDFRDVVSDGWVDI